MNQFIKMDFPEYLRLPYMSVHGLKMFSEDPISYLLSFNNMEDKSTPALDEGKAFHCRVLTPELYYSEFAEAPDVPRRSDKDKAYWKDFMEANKGKVILKHDVIQEIEYMAASVYANPRARELLTGGMAEMTGLWKDQRGFWCKIRPDYINHDHFNGAVEIADLKTIAGDIGGSLFAKEITNRLYHWQNFLYTKGTKIILEVEEVIFHLIVVSKQPPYRCRVFRIRQQDIDSVGNRIEQILDIYGKFMEMSLEQWLSAETEQELELPPWAA